MKAHPTSASRIQGYTIIEALVASSILLIGIGAAASMSLSLVTQEEINERSVQAVNYLDNAAILYHAGVDPTEIQNILPVEPLVSKLEFKDRNLTVAGIGSVPSTDVILTYLPSPATEKNNGATETWTGGQDKVKRKISVEVVRSSSHLTDPLPRVEHHN